MLIRRFEIIEILSLRACSILEAVPVSLSPLRSKSYVHIGLYGLPNRMLLCRSLNISRNELETSLIAIMVVWQIFSRSLKSSSFLFRNKGPSFVLSFVCPVSKAGIFDKMSSRQIPLLKGEIQGDQAARTKPPVDIDVKVAFYHKKTYTKMQLQINVDGRFGPSSLVTL